MGLPGKEARDAYHARRKRMDDPTRQKERLLDLLVEGTIALEHYETRHKRTTSDLLEVEMREKDAKEMKLDIEAALDYACQLLRNPAKLWQAANLKQKRMLQDLFFQEASTRDLKLFGNVVITKAVKLLQPDGLSKSNLVDHLVRNWNSLLRFLQEVEKLGNVA